MSDRIIREAERKRKTGISSTTAWRMEKKGKFPERIQISDGLSGWYESEVDEWVATRPRGMASPPSCIVE